MMTQGYVPEFMKTRQAFEQSLGDIKTGMFDPFIEKTTGYVSPEMEMKRVMSQTDFSNKDSIINTFQTLMKKDPQMAAQWLKNSESAIKLYDDKVSLQDVRTQQLIDKRKKDIRAAQFMKGKDTTNIDNAEKVRQEMIDAEFIDTPAYKELSDYIESFKAESLKQKKQADVLAKEKRKMEFAPVMSVEDGAKTVFGMISRGNFKGTDLDSDERKILATEIGNTWDTYDRSLSGEGFNTNLRLLKPKDAVPYYSRVLQLPEVYTAGNQIPDVVGGKTTTWNADKFREVMDITTGKNQFGINLKDNKQNFTVGEEPAVAISSEFLKYLKNDLIAPDVTVIVKEDGTRVTLSAEEISQYKKQLQPYFNLVE